MKTAKQWAEKLRASLSKRAGFLCVDEWEDAAADIEKMFSHCQREAQETGARVQREQLPEQLRPVIELAYDVVFDIIMNPPSSVKECVEKLTAVSPSLHAARYPGMHG